ncbi:radical SAM protein [Deferribacter autotrophicus]|uniref:Radical SAM protein n=1 Tax=Deferribacter autotrophicus TaxID=500465 RepID=A0A5A8F5V4_9BACT|nr:radical SAM protein [Deferribacter autotrophicus]KAA0258490.1 radical SAM protein [Deferribacter autotrophicus]
MNKIILNINKLKKNIEKCSLCPNKCGVNRKTDVGFCLIKDQAVVASFGKHYGEETVISGTNGSGTIFFAGCNLRCVFCQNYEISQDVSGNIYTPEMLADLFLRLENLGVHNINLVTPTHVIHSIAEAVYIALKKGLSIPVVYNCGGYELPQTIRLLDGLIDIYMPDFKYGDDSLAQELSKINDYTFYAKNSLAEMYNQVGPLILENGIAKKGVLIRHLILPNYVENSIKALNLIRSATSSDIHINIMNQYYPANKAYSYEKLSRRINDLEYNIILHHAKRLNFKIID